MNGTAFTAPRASNARSWLYRIRPSVVESPPAPLTHERLGRDYLAEPPNPSLLGFRPLPLAEAEGDFVDGLSTLAGAGDPAEGPGVAVHLFVAKEHMGRRAFASTDGDLLIAPDTGTLLVRTELGRLTVAPGQIAVVPRALRFAVDLVDGPARGYVFEPYGTRFELPDRGLLGANGLADARHFEIPVACYEDDDEPFRITTKHGGALWDTTRTGSPFDVVAWHGNYAPYRYDLSRFSPVGIRSRTSGSRT